MKTFKLKRTLKSILLLTLVIAMMVPMNIYAASKIQYEDEANKLQTLGLFKGTLNGFELDRSPTRIEALIMMIRIIGKEDEALTSKATHPFTDVDAWADSYVAYAYENGLTKGLSKTKFGFKDIATSAQYLTIVLRALGYDDRVGDFNWQEAAEKAAEIGVISTSEYKDSAALFLRDNCASISYNALLVKKKNEDKTLLQSLVDLGAVKKEAAIVTGLMAETISIRKEGSVVYLPVSAYVEGEEFIYCSANAILAAFPEAKYVVATKTTQSPDEWQKDVVYNYQLAIISDSGFNPIQLNNPYELGLPVQASKSSTIYISIYNKEKDQIGYYLGNNVFAKDLKSIALETVPLIDTNTARSDAYDIISSRSKNCTYFNSNLINTSVALEVNEGSKTARYELMMDQLPISMQGSYGYFNGWQTDKYGQTSLERSIWINALIAYENSGRLPNNIEKGEDGKYSIWLTTDTTRENLLVLYNEEGYLIGYTTIKFQ